MCVFKAKYKRPAGKEGQVNTKSISFLSGAFPSFLGIVNEIKIFKKGDFLLHELIAKFQSYQYKAKTLRKYFSHVS